MRETILRWGCAAILLAIVESCAVAVDLTKDDIDFRKEVYVDKKGDKLPIACSCRLATAARTLIRCGCGCTAARAAAMTT
jgi:hypothetical protein